MNILGPLPNDASANFVPGSPLGGHLRTGAADREEVRRVEGGCMFNYTYGTVSYDGEERDG